MKTLTSLSPALDSLARRFLSLLLAAAWTAFLSSGSAFDVETIKLHGRPTDTVGNAAFGLGLAMSDRYVLVGAPYNSDDGLEAGAAYLFDARTGRFLRRLRPTDLGGGEHFGIRTAIQGNIGAVTATRDDGDRGSVFLFNLSSGRLIAKCSTTDGAPDDVLGTAVAFRESHLLVGAMGDNGNRGAVYLFDVRTGNQLGKVQAPDGSAGDRFGYSLATCGDFLVIGAPGYDGDRGKVYFLSLSTGHWHHEEIGENPGDNFGHSVAMASDSALIGAPGYNGFEGRAYLVVLPGFFLSFIDFPVDASASGPGHQFGGAVAMNENLALVSSWMDGDPVGNAGSVYVFNLRSLTEMGRLTAPDTIPSHFFGSSVALSGNQAAIGARGDSDLELLSGAVYLHRDLAGGLGMNSLAGNRQSAPGTVDAAFRTFRDAYLNPSGEVVFRANLGGPGASRGRNQGAWSNLTDGRVLGLVARRRDPLTADVRIGNVVGAWSNHIDYAVVPATVAGRPVNAGNREVLFIDDGTDLMGVLRTGVDNPFLGAQLRTMQEVVQSGRDRVTVAYRLRRGVSGVTATDDSGIMALAHTGATIDVGAREGRGIPAGEYRQFFGRVAESRDADFFGYPAFLETAGGNVRRQLFSDFAGGGLLYVAAEDGFAPGVGGARYRNFLGETMSENGSMIHRATLNGADVTARNREGIWHEIQGLCFRKGEEPWPFSSPGARFARFLGFWPARTNQVIAWIRLAGPGVTPANDGVLCLFQENGAFLVLLREGDLVPGSSDGARVRTIQRVDVEPELGSYVALVSLTGNPGRNQALYSGYTGVGNPVEETSLRKARLQLRKGAIFDAGLGGTTGIRSLSLSRVRDRAGAGGKGAGQVYGALQRVVMTVTFDDRSREIVVGNP